MRAREFIVEARPPRTFFGDNPRSVITPDLRQDRRNIAKQQQNLKKIDKKYPYQSPIKNYRLVRVQDGFWGIEPQSDGTVALSKRGQVRKTVHFTINGSVGSHLFGNWDNSGVVIIADPKEIKMPPSAVAFEDTYYNVDRNDQLNIGRPIILAPAGLPVPEGLKVTTYSGDRAEALNKTLQSLGIEPLIIHAHGTDLEATYGKAKTRPGAPFDIYDRVDRFDQRRELDLMKQQSGINPSVERVKHYYTKDSTYESAVSVANFAQKEILANGITKNANVKDWVIKFTDKKGIEDSLSVDTDIINPLSNTLRGFRAALEKDKLKPTWNQDQYIYYARVIKTTSNLLRRFTEWNNIWQRLQPGQTVSVQ